MRGIDRAAVYGDRAFWVRDEYRRGCQERTITAFIRPGDRTKDPAQPTWLPRGVDLPVRFIKTPGNQAENRPPVFYPDDGTTVRITEGLVRAVGELTENDLAGMASDSRTVEQVCDHLASIYGRRPRPDDLVTIWRFEYRPSAQT